MQRTILFITFFLCAQAASGQNHLPIIKANTTKVDIRVGDDYFMKGGWQLEPDKNPDIFSIGSKWMYKLKKVSFITDIDSISFDVQPGHQYDFIVMLHEKLPCHIRIVTSPDPIFMNLKIIIPILTGFVAVFLLLGRGGNKIKPTHLLIVGYAVPPFFWLMTFVSGDIHGNYNHIRNTVSELGAIGTTPEMITSSLLIVLALLHTLFSIGFYKESKARSLSVLPAILSFASPTSLIWAAIFPLGNELHGALGPLPLLVMVGSLLLFLLWRKNPQVSALRTMSLISFFIMMLILTRFLNPFGREYAGLVQRFYYAGWTLWTLSITYFLTKKGLGQLSGNEHS